MKNSTIASKQNVLRISRVIHPCVKYFFYRPVLLKCEENFEKYDGCWKQSDLKGFELRQC